MNSPTIHSAEANTFALSIAGIPRTYRNDKEGKRQAILDGLHAITTVKVGEEEYLPSNESLQVVAAVLYPEGIRTEAAYATVCQVTEKACAHLGYGDEVTLGPTHVPFAARGAYRQRRPPVEAQLVRDALAQAGTSSDQPRQEVACALLWHKAGLAVYGRSWSQLTPTQQSLIQTQVDELATQAGWEKDGSANPESYTRLLPLDEAAARCRLAKQSVRANWAALVGGGKVHWIGRKRVRLEGMKAHVKLQATLPCGWVDHILMHKQASLQAMNPEEPFYLLDDGGQRIPPLFYAMLNKCLALPLLPAWAAYLWQSGQEENLVTLLDDGEGQGDAAWRVMPASEAWQEVVQTGLQEGAICF